MNNILRKIQSASCVEINGHECRCSLSPEIGDPDNQVLRLEWQNNGPHSTTFTESGLEESWETKGKIQVEDFEGDWHEIQIFP